MWRDPCIDVLAVIAERPAIEAPVLDRGDVVRHQVVAEFVPFIDGSPEFSAVRLPAHAVGVAQARGENPLVAGGAINFPDRRATCFLLQAIFRDVAVRADGHVQLAAVLAGDDVFGPVMVQCATGQVDHLHGGGGDRSGAVCIVEAQQPIRIRDVQIVADQGHAKGRVEVFNERGAGFGVAVVVGVAQQGDAVRAGHAGTGARHDFFGDPADHACAVIRLGWGVGFGHQHISIG
ncbi:hypothetical protein D3C78_707540 [compost metagenome]